MTWLAKVRFHLRTLFTKRKLDDQLAEEVRAHVDMATEANLAKGMSPDEARYAALREFGNVAIIQEQTRDERGWVWLEQGWQDVRYAFRQLARAPGFTAIVVLTLALGIGGTTALFSMVNTVILNPVGGPEPERMVQIGQRVLIQGKDIFGLVSPPVLDALRARQDEFSNLAWSMPTVLERTTEDFVNMESGAYVSMDFFATLQARPILGRGFLPEEAVFVEDGVPERNTAIVLSHAWWQSQWGGDRAILGRTIEMSSRSFTVVGVMPPHFQFPTRNTQYWVPYMDVRQRPNTASVGTTRIFAQLKSSTTVGQAQSMLDTLSQQLMEAHPVNSAYGGLWRLNNQGLNISLRPLSVALQDGGNWAQLRQTLLGLFVAVCFVLLIVCANVANLTLARLERRQHELTVRAALGAGRGRLMRQLFVENLILALLGGAAGLLVTSWGLRVLIAVNAMPRLRPIEIDGKLLGVTLAISAATALVLGLAPMWRGGTVRPQALLADGGLNTTGARRGRLYLNALAVVQVAITVVLLTGAGLMLLSVARILQVDPGFDPQNLLLVEAQLPWRKYDIPNKAEGVKLQNALIDLLHERFSALPGVKAVGTQQVGLAQSFEFPNRKDRVVAQHSRVGIGVNDAFRAMGTPLQSGRHFAADDVARPEVVIINEAMARQFWPGETALGKRFGGGDGGPASTVFEVVGVLSDTKMHGYLSETWPIIYHPLGAVWTKVRMISRTELQFVIRSERDPEILIPLIRQALKEAEPAFRAPIFKVATLVLYDSTLAQRTYRNYLGLFALLGLLLSALGVYGVLAFSVARRTREIGIRMAIGADAGEVRAMVLRQGGRLIVTGVIIGLLASLGLTRLLQSQLFEVSPTDPVVMLGAVVVLGVIGLVACWLPARRAAKVDPVIALRAE